jgi:hypothetical protein
MTLNETLKAIHEAAKTYKGGTQITPDSDLDAVRQSLWAFEDLIAMAKRKGATGYEIERAMKGEFIGHSFT